MVAIITEDILTTILADKVMSCHVVHNCCRPVNGVLMSDNNLLKAWKISLKHPLSLKEYRQTVYQLKRSNDSVRNEM